MSNGTPVEGLPRLRTSDPRTTVCASSGSFSVSFGFSSVFLSWIAIETFINTISENFSIASRLNHHEKSFLNEKELKELKEQLKAESK